MPPRPRSGLLGEVLRDLDARAHRALARDRGRPQPMMNLALRKVDHPQARDNYRVVYEVGDGEKIEVGSIGVQVFTSAEVGWTWAIDTVVPMRAMETEGRDRDRKDCERLFNLHGNGFARIRPA
jgi:hypothetical protein